MYQAREKERVDLLGGVLVGFKCHRFDYSKWPERRLNEREQEEIKIADLR